MKKYQLISENLRKVHASAEEIISSHVQRLDRISNDIKVLEEILLKAGIPFVFQYYFKNEFFVEDLGDEKIDQIHYYLIWDKNRIIYQVENKNDQPQESMPLIETKSHVRLSVENELASFYEGISLALEKNPVQSAVWRKSPNFEEIVHEYPF